jgi:predicted DNA-binding transcriptional regulator AlpA
MVATMFQDEPTQSQLKTHRKMMRPPEAAKYCGSTASTFAKFRLYGTGPVYAKIGHRVVYHPDDLDHWIASRRRTSTSDRAPADSRRSPSSI